jgi:integrase
MSRKTYKNIITSEELTAQINPENLKLMKQFLKEKNTRSSDGTIKNYESDLTIFFTWNLLNNDNKLFTDIRKIQFSDFFSYAVLELRWGSARFSRAKATLSSLSNFIEKFYDDVYPNFRNVILKAIESMPKNAVREKTILTELQVDSLLNYFGENDPQIACWLALAVASGSRFSELLRFAVSNIDTENMSFQNIFIETLKPIKSKGRTKSGKLLYKYIIKDIFLPHYQKWLPIRQKIMEEHKKNHDFIFIKANGDPAQESTARSWVSKIEDCIGINIYPHCFRHYSTSYLVKCGLPYNLVKEIMGWASVDMVNVYDDSTAKDKTWAELDGFKKILDDNKSS